MDTTLPCDYDDVKNNCKGGIYMRKHYLDNIRWITVVIVVIYHVLYMYNAEGILGGLGKITSLSVQPYDILMYLVYPWFMHLLWIYSMILVLLRLIEKGRLLKAGGKAPIWLILLLYFPIWGAAQILNTPIIAVYRIGFYFVFYMFGYYVFSNDEVMEKLKRYAIPFLAAGAVLCIVFSVLYFSRGANYADKPVNRNPLYAACAYFGSLAVLSGMARFGDRSSSVSKWMSRKSFGLYVFHYLGISSVALFLAKPGLVPAPASYLLSLIAGFAFGYGLYEIISRIPFFRWAVLGIKKEKK